MSNKVISLSPAGLVKIPGRYSKGEDEIKGMLDLNHESYFPKNTCQVEEEDEINGMLDLSHESYSYENTCQVEEEDEINGMLDLSHESYSYENACQVEEEDEINGMLDLSHESYSYENACQVEEKDEITDMMEKKSFDFSKKKETAGETDMVTDPERESCLPYKVAGRFLHMYTVMRFEEKSQQLWIFSGKCYEPLESNILRKLVYDLLSKSEKESIKSLQDFIGKVVFFIQHETMGNPVFHTNKKYIFGEKDFEKIKGKVVFQNGIYDLKKRRFFKNSFNKDVPFYYCLNAEFLEDERETSHFDRIISDACGGDADTIQTIKDCLAVLLIPDRLKFIPVAGTASNSGKSLILGHFLNSLFPANRISNLALGDFTKSFALGNAEQLLLISSLDCDMEAINPKTSSLLKRITGEERISVRQIYKEQTDVAIRFKMVFATNGSFCASQSDIGLVNRVVALPFIKEAKQIDLSLQQKLDQERNAIATMLLRDFAEVYGQDGTIKIRESKLSKECKKKWCMANTYMSDFVLDCIKITKKGVNNYATNVLYSAYSSYFESQKCINKNETSQKLNRNDFINRLLAYPGIYRGRVNAVDTTMEKAKFNNSRRRICGLILDNRYIDGQ